MLLVLAIGTACGGGGDEGPTGNPGSITVAVNPGALTVQQGGTGTVNIALTRGGGFSGAVSLAIAGLPSGVTTTVTPASLSGATTSATVLVAVASTVPAGTYTATVRGSAAGIGEATTTYTLTVTAAPDFTLAATPAALTIAQGGNGTSNIAITRSNFAGAVALALQNAPAGITGTFTPAAPTGDASALSVAVAATVAPGTYNVTIQGTGTGIAPKSAALAITVTAAAGYTLAVAPATMALAPGSNGTATVNIDRTNFQGAVTLSLDSPPAGISATFLPAASTTNASTMTVSVGAAVAPGTYTVTVRGTATGLADRTAQFTLNVSAPAYTIAIAPTQLTVQQGNAGTATLTISRTNFTGAVSLVFDSPPAGISGTFAPGTTTGTSSTFTVNVASNTPLGTYNLSLRATATGLTDRVLFFPVTVSAAPGGIALSLSPAAVTVQQGASGSTTVNITRTNYPGDVTLQSSGAPGGVTIGFTPSPTTASSSTANIAVGAGTPAGTYSVTITGTGAGLTPVNTSLSLTVATPGSGGNAEWQFCSASETPVFFAYQDGTNAWQRVTPSTAGTVTKFNFTISSGRGAVAYVLQETSARIAADATVRGSRSRLVRGRALFEQQRSTNRRARGSYARAGLAGTYTTEVFYGTATELTTVGTDNCNDTQSTKTITGTVAGVGVGQLAVLSLGGALAMYTGTGSPTVTFRGVASGAVDFVGTRSTVGMPADKVVLFRNLSIPDGGAMPSVIDFDAASAFAPATATATFTNTMNEELMLNTLLTTANGETLGFANDFSPSVDPARTWAGLPGSRMISGDVHGLYAFASPAGGNSSDARILLKYVGAVANQTMDLGPKITEPTITSLAVGAYPRFRFQGALPTEYRQLVSFSITSSAGSTSNSLTISATGGYLAAVGSASTYDLAMPDIAGLNGFPVGSRLEAGQNTTGTTAFGWTGAGIITPQPRAGDLLRGSTRSTDFNVP
ncbi:MAG: hypothetical protein IT361_05220 [Gemmatimonadaceae bacterium]|nr:hypothetical protein [Gemmatimonadaceae bacterium]